MTDALTVWLHGEELGALRRLRTGRLRLQMSAGALDRYGVGSVALSLAIPVTSRRVEGVVLDRFLEGLLPEAAVRAALERQHRVAPGDTFGMLTAIGRECAGAIQFTPDGDVPGDGTLRPLSRDEVERIVEDLPTLEPPAGTTVGASLGGVQSKVLLTRTADGWAWPVDGAVSTHLVKPEPVSDAVVPDLVEHEAWAMSVAAGAGLPAASVELATFGDRRAIVVERYDRHGGRRTHQEDFTQALSIATAEKYEPSSSDPPRLLRIARRAGEQAVDPTAFRLDLLRLVTFNAVIGNGDAHSKNYSLVLDVDGSVSLAPLYDAAPVFLLARQLRHSGHALDGQTNLAYVTAGHLVRTATSWGVNEDEARDVVRAVALAVADVATLVDAPDVDTDVPGRVAERAAAFAADATNAVDDGGLRA
ncbi:HipA domain-containing protein [Cellulosimicrobium sp. PMB13]|uniref:HipA domain-containing protein n=1 Tax=Cellulosimicrobium sp. PMB13 TaxID=3120158 RepID=UPI003F4B8137